MECTKFQMLTLMHNKLITTHITKTKVIIEGFLQIKDYYWLYLQDLISQYKVERKFCKYAYYWCWQNKLIKLIELQNIECLLKYKNY